MKKSHNTSRSKIFYPIIVLTLSLIVSCSSDDENTQPTNDIYLSIPDIHFETKLIEQGIDLTSFQQRNKISPA